MILIITWLLIGGLSSQGLELVYKLINLSRTSQLFLATTGLFHPIYNIISLTVILSMFSPIQHALLNVAKRVTVVLGFLIFTYSTSTGVSMTNIISGCLCITVIIWGNRVKEVRLSVFYIVLCYPPCPGGDTRDLQTENSHMAHQRRNTLHTYFAPSFPFPLLFPL